MVTMKSLKNNKISRCKVPNLLHLAAKPNVSSIVWPKFFSKIENSLKLLEQTSLRLEAVATEQAYKGQCIKHPIPEIKQPSRNKLRSTSMPHKLQALHIADSTQNKPATLTKNKQKMVTLPQMSCQTTKNLGVASAKPLRHKSTLSQHLQRHKSNQLQSPQFQSISSGTFAQKGLEQILKEKQEQERVRRQQGYEEGSEPDSEEDEQNKPSKRESEVFQRAEQSQGLQEMSARIIGAQPRLYENYDKKLMEKVKIYKPKKFQFNHQLLWRV